MQFFNSSTFYKICEQLPYTIQCKVYDIEENDREKMKKMIKMVTRARTNAERRAKDKNTYPSDSAKVPSKVNIHQTPFSSTPSKDYRHTHTPNITGTEENNPNHGPRTTGNNLAQAKIRTNAKRIAKDKNNRLWRSKHPPRHHGCHLTTPSTRHKISKRRTERSCMVKKII